MDENDLSARLSDVAATEVDRDAVILGMQRREAAHARRRRTHLAMGAAACVVVVLAGGIGLAATGAFSRPAEQHPASTATTAAKSRSAAAPSSPTTLSGRAGSSGSDRMIGGFDTDPQLNWIASNVAEMLTTAVQNEPNYAGVRIIGTGVELSIVGDLTTAESAAVDAASARGTQDLTDVTTVPPGSTFQITVRHVRYTMKQLSTIVEQITSDSTLANRGVTVSAVGVDMAKNLVDLSVVPYSAKIAQLIHEKYGDAVVVRTHPLVAAGS